MNMHREMHRFTQYVTVNGYVKHPLTSPEKLYKLSSDLTLEEKMERNKAEGAPSFTKEELLASFEKQQKLKKHGKRKT